METWLLALTYGVHLIATVVIVGVLLSPFGLSRVLFPAQEDGYPWLTGYRTFLRLSWMAVALLWATGMFQMSRHPLYQGTLNFSTPWARGLFIKHLLVLAWMAVLAYTQGVLLPEWERMVLRMRSQQAPAQATLVRLRQRMMRSLRIQQGLVLAVLLVTAWLRAQG